MKWAKNLVSKIKSLLASREVDHTERIGPPSKRRRSAPKPKRVYSTPFQIAWESLRQKRIRLGLPVSGYIRTCLRARLRGRTA